MELGHPDSSTLETFQKTANFTQFSASFRGGLGIALSSQWSNG